MTMRNLRKMMLLLAAVLIPMISFSQIKWMNPLEQNEPVIGGRWWNEELKENYHRIPDRAEKLLRAPLWGLSKNSAGLYIQFRSNAPSIHVRYKVSGDFAMKHMPSTGVSGVDLYATDINGVRRWCGSQFSYSFGDTVRYSFNDITYYPNNTKHGYEYKLYLPLYNTVEWMEIGVNEDCKLDFMPVSKERPIVMYGTSIAQGACASRPGMAWTNIIERETEHPVINLGFSGNGQCDAEMFDLMSEIDAQLYLFDFLPNMTDMRTAWIYDRVMYGVKKIREKNNCPILFIEHEGYPNYVTSAKIEKSFRDANKELKRVYDALVAEGVKNLFYHTHEETNLDMDGTVEGVHPNDWGMRNLADAYIPQIKKILNENIHTTTCFTPCKQQRDSYNWYNRHEAELALNAKENPDILMVGNSITHFWGGEPAFPQRCFGQKSWNKMFKGKKAHNMGFGWDRIENVMWRFYHGELDGIQAKKMFIMLGTNNIGYNTYDEILQGVLNVIEIAKSRQPGMKIYVQGIYPRRDKEAEIAAYNKRLEEALKGTDVTYIEVASALTDENGKLVESRFIGDGLHPNEEGYNRLAAILKKYVDE